MTRIRPAAAPAAPRAPALCATISSAVADPTVPPGPGSEAVPRFRPFALTELDRRFETLRLAAPSAKQAELRTSIEADGQRQPVLVALDAASGAFLLLDGFKRCDALAALGIPTVWARLIDHDPIDSLAAMLDANARQLGAHEVEQAWIVAGLRDLGLEQIQIAHRLARSASWVCRRLQLVERLLPAVISDVRAGLLSPRSAQELAQLPRGNQAEVARAIVRHKLSSRQAARLVQVWRLSRHAYRADLLEDPLPHLDDRSTRRAKPDPRLSAPGNELRRQLLAAMEAIHRIGDLVGDAPTKALLLADAPTLAPWSRSHVAKARDVLTMLDRELHAVGPISETATAEPRDA